MERTVAGRRWVSEVMTRAVVSVAPDMSVEDARRQARETGAHHQLVLDRGTLVGVICSCDLAEAEPGAEISDCMSVPVMTVHPDQSLAAAVAIMADCGVGCLPVVSGGLVVGLLSEDQLARAGMGPRLSGRCRCHARVHPARVHRPGSPSRREPPSGPGRSRP